MALVRRARGTVIPWLMPNIEITISVREVDCTLELSVVCDVIDLQSLIPELATEHITQRVVGV